ncbi:MAG: rhodanese-like domain-containing protein, partial [Sciscionella sp.]
AAEKMARGALLVDLRPWEYRLRAGEIPGAVAVSRHVLEWRLDRTSEAHLKELDVLAAGQPIMLLCNEGYTSCLAAYELGERLELGEIGDVIDGFSGWSKAGLPVLRRLTG